MAENTPQLDGKQLAELMKLINDADSVELKMTVPDADSRGTVRSLQLDPIEAQIRQVVFFDTPDLKLNDNGLVVRARRSQGAPDDSVVKLRPVVPSQLPDELRRTTDFNVEVDAMPGGYVCSGSYKGRVPAGEVKQVLQGTQQIRKLFSKGQRAFYDQHAPEGIKLEQLAVLGPITVLKLKWQPTEFKRRMVAELWFYPDGSRILELSTKAPPEDAFDLAAGTRAFLKKKGLDLTAEQQPKTNRALKHFTDQLKQLRARN
jgi:hypothetical protein